MPIHPFGEWLPDQPALGNAGVLRADNVVPGATGYLPFPEFEPATNALDERPRGAIQARDSQNNVFQYAGDRTKLYRNVAGIWVDHSPGVGEGGGEGEGEGEDVTPGPYTTGPDEIWDFVPWKNKVLATNYSDFPQQITFGATEFEDLTTDLRGRRITTIRDFVVLANTVDNVDNEVPSRVRWSAFNNETDFTVSPATLSGFQDLKTAKIDRIFGGEFGVILQPSSIWRMSFVGVPTAFQFDEVLPGIGVLAPGAATQVGATVFFLSNQGFFALENGTQAVPIGAGKVDRFVLDDLDQNFISRISMVADNASQRVLCAYPGTGNIEGRPNRIVVFDRALGRWALIDQEVELLWRSGGAGTNVDSVDIPNVDLDDTSVDSVRFIGGIPAFGAFDAANRSGFFDGESRVGLIETGEYAFHEGGRSYVMGFRPLHEGGMATAQVGTRNSLSDNVQYGQTLQQGQEGAINCRVNARYHRFRMTFNDDWAQAIGIEIPRYNVKKAGRRA